MTIRSSIWILLGSGLLATAAGCSSDSTTDGSGGSGATAGTGGSGGSGGAGMGGQGGAGAGGTAGSAGSGGVVGKSRLRFAHLGPNVAPTVRVCATAAGATKAVDLTAALPAGLGYPQVSAYLDVAEGTYDVKVVDAAGDCTTAAIVDAPGIVIPDGSIFTAVVSGDATSGDAANKPGLRVLTDRTQTGTATHVRLVHAAAGAPVVDVGAYVGTAFAKVFPAVSYGVNHGLAAASTDPTTPVDASGYAALPIAIDSTTVFEIRLAATGQVYGALSSPVPLPAGSTATVFAHGLYTTDSAGNGSGVGVLACLDGTEGSGLTTCVPFATAAAQPPRPQVRVAHVSPDSAAALVDVCVKPSSYPKWLADSSQAAIQGLAYRSVTTALPGTRLPADTYDVKLLAHATPTDCSKDAADPGLAASKLAIDGATRATIAATGLTAAGANHFVLNVYPNTDTTTETTHASVRFIHAAAGIAAVDLGPVAGAFLWSDIAYGAAGDYKATLFSGGDLVGINYQSTADYDIVTLALTAAQSTVKGDVYTLWPIGDLTAGTTNTAPAALLLCEETPAAAGPTLSCSELPLALPTP
jgi:hypothetical protein